ncbi:PAS domain-containing protein [Halobellus limi]|uniref:PAS domain S-box-containing protein n=1 Tax=Halobellus limi TaxID=699433 RepID=A0A1H5VPE4_9EURY|nr:PAS domain-containing protein [Halobellus limi]QCC46665.1 PAS domain-containing protein [Halobellus limi]SEF88711.1 PAS domain S-box-containing protein [Halobellus limi]
MTRGADPGVRTRSAVRQRGDGVAAAAKSASTDAVDESLKTRTMDEAPVGITIADARKPDMPLIYANAAFERITGYPPAYAVGRNCRFLQGEVTREKPVGRMRAAIEEERATTVEIRNYRRSGEVFWNEVTLAPLRDDSGDVAYYVGFQQDVTRRKRAERAAAERASRIERERIAQERLLDRLDGVVADVTEAVTRASSRAALEREVVRSIADTYVGAWIGRYDPAADAVVPRVAEGIPTRDEGVLTQSDEGRRPPEGEAGERDPGESVQLRASGGDRSAEGEPDVGAVETAITEALEDRYVHIEPIEPGKSAESTAVAGVPLHHGEAAYGAIAVYVRNDEFHSYERAVLTALGRTVAVGINAIESQRTLQGEEVVEVRFALGTHPLVELASALGGRLQYAGSVGDREGPSLLFEVVDADGLDAAALREAADAAGVTVHGVLGGDADAPVAELSIGNASLRDLLRDHSGELRDWQVDSEAARVTVEVGREALAQSLSEAARDRFENAELVGYRRRERREETHQGFVAELESRLTERQRAALVRAHTAGYFEWPHETDGEEIADSMGVCRSTFHQHLRAAQRKLAAAVLDR